MNAEAWIEFAGAVAPIVVVSSFVLAGALLLHARSIARRIVADARAAAEQTIALAVAQGWRPLAASPDTVREFAPLEAIPVEPSDEPPAAMRFRQVRDTLPSSGPSDLPVAVANRAEHRTRIELPRYVVDELPLERVSPTSPIELPGHRPHHGSQRRP